MDSDYKALGLKCGIEVHQQLDSGKLFCRCPSILREDKPDVLITRYQRAVASELGEYDKAALEATQKKLAYVYELYSDTNCELEADECPPVHMDEEALKTVLEIALMANADILPELFIMRKTVSDGSVVSGFQRTALVALGGELDIGSKKIGLLAIIIEEDAARPTKKTENEIFYRLDRLGIPLIEIATAPEIFSPQEAKQTALALGELVRRTGKVKRGLGTIRQDLNISIAKGARIELKGVQELELIEEFVKREVQRQNNLLKIKEELEKRNLSEKDLTLEMIYLNDLLKETDAKLLKNALQQKQSIMGLKLKKFAGLIGRELQPNRRLGTEFSDYVKAKSALKGLFHSDELPNYGITEEEKQKIAKKLDCGEEDGFAMVCGSSIEVQKALNAVLERARHCLKGVPEETRNALAEGNSEYSRPLPGAARMYPETDLESIKLDEKLLNEIKKNLPLSAEQRMDLYQKKFHLGKQLAEKMKSDNFARFFEEIVSKGFDATNTAVLLLEGLVQLKREGAKTDNISNEMIEEVLLATKNGLIQRGAQLNVLRKWSEKPFNSLNQIIKELQLKGLSENELRKIILQAIERNKKLIAEKKEFASKALMGEIMREVKGKADGKTIAKILEEELKKC